MSTLIHIPLVPACEDYSFFDEAVVDFEHGLDCIFTDSIKTLELDASFDEPDIMPSSVSLAFLHLVSTISDNSKPQLTPIIKSHKL